MEKIKFTCGGGCEYNCSLNDGDEFYWADEVDTRIEDLKTERKNRRTQICEIAEERNHYRRTRVPDELLEDMMGLWK